MTRHGPALGTVAATLAIGDWERRRAVCGPVDDVMDDEGWCAANGVADEIAEEER